MADEERRPEIIECELRLHAARPAPPGPGGAASWAEWSATAVGDPVTFKAVASPTTGAWNGPLAPGAAVPAPVDLAEPVYSVFLPAARGLPLLVGEVGRPLAIGECFDLPPGTPGEWTEGVPFDGAIVID